MLLADFCRFIAVLVNNAFRQFSRVRKTRKISAGVLMHGKDI